MRKKKINLEEIQEIREPLINMYIRDKKSYREICNELGIDKHQLHNYLKLLDIPARKRGGNNPPRKKKMEEKE